jgi:hypothetical protein
MTRPHEETLHAGGGETEVVMSGIDVLGMLIGISLVVAVAAYLLFIYFHPEHFRWLVSADLGSKSNHDPSLTRE